MDIKQFLEEWLAASNAYDTAQYLKKYDENAVLDDLSVGRTFTGHDGICKYFEDYFIGYKTQTRMVKADIKDNSAQIEVEFTGEFPEGKTGGIFDFIFKNGKIVSAKADLL
jgi:hypothetical protein